ncbi:MAG: hypothetical protein RL019_1549, partial [Pseudomonadota bacterium]
QQVRMRVLLQKRVARGQGGVGANVAAHDINR